MCKCDKCCWPPFVCQEATFVSKNEKWNNLTTKCHAQNQIWTQRCIYYIQTSIYLFWLYLLIFCCFCLYINIKTDNMPLLHLQLVFVDPSVNYRCVTMRFNEHNTRLTIPFWKIVVLFDHFGLFLWKGNVLSFSVSQMKKTISLKHRLQNKMRGTIQSGPLFQTKESETVQE